MNSTEIVIAYEDRLRLSELAGQLTDAQWIVDNPIVANLVFMILIGFLITVVAVIGYAVITAEFTRSAREDKSIAMAIAVLATCLFVASIYALHESQVHDVAVIQAQIDEIERIWGLKEGL